MHESSSSAKEDADIQETREWREAFLSMLEIAGTDRACFMLNELSELARAQRIGWQPQLATPYINSLGWTSNPCFQVIWPLKNGWLR